MPEIKVTYIIGNSRGSMGQPGPPGGIIIICWTGILNLCSPTKYCGPPASGGPDGSWGVGGRAEGCGPSVAAAAADGLAAAGLPGVSSVTDVEGLSWLSYAPLTNTIRQHCEWSQLHTFSKHHTWQCREGSQLHKHHTRQCCGGVSYTPSANITHDSIVGVSATHLQQTPRVTALWGVSTTHLQQTTHVTALWGSQLHTFRKQHTWQHCGGLSHTPSANTTRDSAVGGLSYTPSVNTTRNSTVRVSATHLQQTTHVTALWGSQLHTFSTHQTRHLRSE